MEDLESLKKQLEANAVRVTDVNLLFLDLSSNCTGYSLISVDFEKRSAKFLNAGAIWFDNKATNQEKYHYLYSSLVNYFNIVGKIDYCFTEAYMINIKRVMGCQIGPEMHGVVSVALAEIGVKYSDVPVSTWRKHLGVKKDAKGSFKEPTKQKVLEYTTLPNQIKSNITGTMRDLPNDITDALGMTIGVLTKLGITKLDFSKLKIQENIDI